MKEEKALLPNKQPPRPPNGGWGWVIVVAVLVNGIFTWGVLIGYSIFFQPLMEELDVTLGQVTMVNGAHEIARAIGHLTMPVFGSRFGVRISAVVLSLISAISISVTVFVERNISMCILLGVIPGFVMGNLNVLNYVIVAQYFDTKKYFALAISQTGAAIGGVTLPPFFQWTINEYGVRGALLLTGGVSFNCVAASALLRPWNSASEKTSSSKSIFEDFHEIIQLCKRPKFWVASLVLSGVYGGARIFTTFLALLANSYPNADEIKSSLLLSLVYGISIFTRVGIGYVGDLKFVDEMWLLFVFSFSTSIVLAAGWFISSYNWLLVQCIIYSFTTSTVYIMVVPVVIAAVGEAKLELGVSLTGFMYTVVGAFLVPATGSIIDALHDYKVSCIAAALTMLTGSLLHIPLFFGKKSA